MFFMPSIPQAWAIDWFPCLMSERYIRASNISRRDGSRFQDRFYPVLFLKISGIFSLSGSFLVVGDMFEVFEFLSTTRSLSPKWV